MTRLIGVDVGGTNTDLVFVDTEAGELRVAKVPSTPANQADGLMHGSRGPGESPSTVSIC